MSERTTRNTPDRHFATYANFLGYQLANHEGDVLWELVTAVELLSIALPVPLFAGGRLEF